MFLLKLSILEPIVVFVKIYKEEKINMRYFKILHQKYIWILLFPTVLVKTLLVY